MKIPERLFPVYVYRNLRHGKNAEPLYSIMYKGKVIARRHRVLLSTCTFVVRKAGREKAILTGHKNVHAFVKGALTGRRGCMGMDATGKDFGMRIRYNPYLHSSFVYHAPGMGYHGRPVRIAGAVLLNENGISACYTG